MKTWLKLSLLLFCCVAFVQCKKKKPSQCDFYYYGTDPYLEEHFRFLPGTSWNYINENTLDTNNIFVTSVNDHAVLSVDNHSAGGEGCYPDGKNYFDHIEINLSDGWKLQLIPNGITTNQPAANRATIYNYLNQTNFNATFIDTLILPTGNYYAVHRYKGYSHFSSSYMDSSYFYFNEEYGIVRKELYVGHGQTDIWNLSSATIVR